jgi:BRCT domain type II-containing protein
VIDVDTLISTTSSVPTYSCQKKMARKPAKRSPQKPVAKPGKAAKKGGEDA